ncbi:CPBP family intramembrane glutamic endopeptidase [Myxococcus sp. Y35]|uniref:CPBP family intramembrane glutamic endopeptidase n=1 Tax=Pseudomyxococcus flavus TaxID=3115648 RepID=UPI003CF00D3F
MSNVYLEQAARGLNQPWRYVLTAILLGLSVTLFNVPYSVFVYLAAQRAGDTGFRFDLAAGVVENMPFPVFMVGMVSFVVMLGMLAICVRALHKRPFTSLLGQEGGFRLGIVVKAAAGTFAVLGVATLVNVLVDGDSFRVNFEAGRFFSAVLLTLALVPLQAAAEELLYRGWLMQGLYRLVLRPWFAVGVSSLMFWVAHLPNPEASATPVGAAAYYLAVGSLLAWLTLRTGRLEAAIGVHTGLNLCSFLVASPESMMFQAASIFVDVRPGSARDLVLVALLAGSLFLVLRRGKRRAGLHPVAVR